ncbi:MAG: DUF4330 domain-containing protein [Defluviitaleaceae bacterium]|nr:DUF4330 domain-containing protein [Defluviitaleaceae bacterium]
MKLNKFNIVDGVIVLAFLAVLAAGAFFLTRGGGGDEVMVFFDVEFQQMEQSFIELVEEGDEIRDAVRNYFLGHVYDVRIEPSVVLVFDSIEGRFMQTVTPERYDIFITVSGRGTESNEAIYVEGQIVRVGREMSITGKGYANTGFIVGLRTERIAE